jgi:dihydroorotate dehydrogenase (fumarate)
MKDLSTTYLGLELKNPLVASASPLSEKLETVQELEQAGVAAIVMHSLFEEEIIHESLELDHYLSYGEDISAESPRHWPEIDSYLLKPDLYIDKLTSYKKAVSIPIIGSLNGVSKGGWTDYAKRMEAAGADAVELNLYYLPANPSLAPDELEKSYIKLVGSVRKSIKIPLAVKLSPFFTALPHMAKQLVEAGADGLVLFNRFYQPDIDLEALEVTPHLVLSSSQDLRLPLRWIAILYERVKADFALTSGVHTAEDVIKAMMAGASVAMMASELLENGIRRIPVLLQEIEKWMVAHEYESIRQMRGSLSQKKVSSPATYERTNYMKALKTYRRLP